MRCLEDISNNRILVIDDNPSVHDDFKRILVKSYDEGSLSEAKAALFIEDTPSTNQLSFQVDVASQGHLGLQKVVDARRSGLPYALVFVDMRMPPGWDGLTTIEKLWEEDPDLEIVICTAYSDTSWSEINKRCGRTDQLLILKKPFDIVEVRQLAVALARKWDLRQLANLKLDQLNKIIAERTQELSQKESLLRQKFKSEAIGTLANGLAHEMNNLLQIIQANSEFMIDRFAADEIEYEDLSQIIMATHRGRTITDRLLRFCRKTPESSAIETFPINRVVQNTIDLLEPLMSTRISLDAQLHNDAGVVCADETMLSQAILNLLINAKDAMPKGGKLSVSTESLTLVEAKDDIILQEHSLTPGPYAVIRIRDTGTGIPIEIRERMFDPYFTTKQVGEGSGMGLAIALGTLKSHSGAIDVRSTLGDGSVFSVLIPKADDSRSLGLPSPYHDTSEEYKNYSNDCRPNTWDTNCPSNESVECVA